MNKYFKSLIAACTLLPATFSLSAQEVDLDTFQPEKLRPAPLRTLDCKKVLNVTKFGAKPDDGKDDWKGISKALEKLGKLAVDKDHPVKLVIPAGTYEITPSKDYRVFSFIIDGFEGFEIDATGATFMIQDPTVGLFQVKNSSYGIIRGLSSDYSKPVYAQGRARHLDREKGSFDFYIEDGFPKLDEEQFEKARKWGAFFKEDGLHFNDSTANCIFMNKVTKNPDGSFKMEMKRPSDLKHVVENNRFVYLARHNGHQSYRIDNSHQISMIGCTIWHGPAFGFNSIKSMINVIDCRILRKPGFIVSQNGDAVHIIPHDYGPWIEGNIFEGHMDDGMNIKTELLFILKKHNPRLYTIAFRDDRHMEMAPPEPGQRLRLFDPVAGKLLGEFKIESIMVKGKTADVYLDKPYNGIVRCGKKNNATMFYNADRSNSGFVVKNNVFRDSRRFGIIVQACNGIIENNLFHQTSAAALIMHNGAGWPEGFVPENIIVRGNVIEDCGFDQSFCIYGENASPIRLETNRLNANNKNNMWLGTRNFLIEKNIIKAPHSAAIYVGACKDIVIRNNEFYTSQKDKPVLTEASEDVVVTGNKSADFLPEMIR